MLGFCLEFFLKGVKEKTGEFFWSEKGGLFKNVEEAFLGVFFVLCCCCAETSTRICSSIFAWVDVRKSRISELSM